MKIFLIFLGLAMVIISPQFLVKSFALIDNGTDFLFVRDNSFIEIVKDQLVISERTRPLRFIIKKICFEILNLNVMGYFVVEAVLLATCGSLMYLILKKLSKNLTMTIVGIMAFLLSPPVVANFYRLGTDEGWQLGCLLLGLYMWMLKKDKVFLSVLIMSLFFKETSIFFLILPLWYLWEEKKWKLLSINLLAIIIFGSLIAYKYFQPGSFYINQAGLTWNLLLENFYSFGGYFVTVLIVLGGILYRLIRYPKLRKKEIMMFLGVVMASIPLFIWRVYGGEYYLLILLAILVIGVVYIGNYWSRKWQMVIIFLGILLTIFELPRSITLAKFWHEKYIVEGALSEYLLKNDFSNIVVFSNEIDLEENHKIYVYANEWFGRCKTFFPPIKSWVATFNDKNGFEVRRKLATESGENFLKSKDKKKMLISKGKRNDMFGHGEEAICGFSVFSGKICRYYIYR